MVNCHILKHLLLLSSIAFIIADASSQTQCNTPSKMRAKSGMLANFDALSSYPKYNAYSWA
jgi:hypothetical protein